MSFKKYMKCNFREACNAILGVLVGVLQWPGKAFIQTAKFPRPTQIFHMILNTLHSESYILYTCECKHILRQLGTLLKGAE